MSVTNTTQADPLPSWNDGAAKRNVQAFVRAVTDPKSPDFVPPFSAHRRLRRDGVSAIFRLPELEFFDDKGDKPVAIQKFIGRRPIAAFGNSDGDLQMLQWTAAGSWPAVHAAGRSHRRHTRIRVSRVARWDASTSRRRKPNSAVGRSSA